MCGIAGTIGHGAGPETVTWMIELMRHRGPDGQGVFANPEAGVALGHRRLAVLDVSDAGRQPMTSRDRRWTIVLNGEIFNYKELRRQLGYGLRTGTDTEALLEACAAWGVEKALERSVGMFAFALWDARNRELTLARDRAGEKPLLYCFGPGGFSFASELKALAPRSERRLDPLAVEAYLALGYVPAPLSIFRDCRKLAPGHLLRFRGGTPEVRRWWFPEHLAPHDAESPSERIERLRTLFADAVRLRLRSDAPVALWLSGGVDSSAVAAECVREGAGPDAFTVRMEGGEQEVEHARVVAQGLGLRHEIVHLGRSCLASLAEQTVRCYDEPFADTSAIPSLALAGALAGRYKVVLNGEGGDEAFGGYRHYEYIGAKQALKAAGAALGLCDGRSGNQLGIYVQSKSVFRSTERARFLNGNGRRGAVDDVLDLNPFLHAARNRGPLKNALWSDRYLYLANDLMYKSDIALGAAGMEGRAPFLDHRLVAWAQSLDESDLVSGRSKKVLLREAYRRELPAAVLDRPKRGFGAPLEEWMSGPLREFVQDSLPCPLLDVAGQRRLRGPRLWTLATFSRWARQWRASW